MPVALFKPKGEKSQVQIVYEAVKDTPYGELITYERFFELTGFEQDYIRGLSWGVNKKLLKEDQKYLSNVRNVGYRLVHPPEQLGISSNRKTRADRQVKKGLLTVVNIDMTHLSVEEKQRQAHLLNHLTSIHKTVRKKQTAAITQTERSLRLQREALSQLDSLAAEIDSMRKKLSE